MRHSTYLSKTKLAFLGYVIDANVIRADFAKTEVIVKINPPIPTLKN